MRDIKVNEDTIEINVLKNKLYIKPFAHCTLFHFDCKHSAHCNITVIKGLFE